MSFRPNHSFSRLLPLFSLSAFIFGATGCDRDLTDKEAEDSRASRVIQRPTVPLPEPSVPSQLQASEEQDAGVEDAGPPPPHPGPFLYVVKSSVGVYSETSFDRKKKLGYARSGAKLPIHAGIVSKESCSSGWYKVVGGGYVCANAGTLDEKDPEVRFATKQPNFDGVLPYVYARNAKHGTPLYKSVPSPEQMLQYEPYLDEDGDKKEKDKGKTEAKPAERRDAPSSEARPASLLKPADESEAQELDLEAIGAALLGDSDAGAPEPETPWWQEEEVKDVTIEDLSAEEDDILARRMVRGFYVAIDKTFRWNDRTWYRTTKNLVVPADRFWQTAGPKFQGVELDAENQLPQGWVYGGRKKISTYSIDEQKQQIKPARTLARFDRVALTGRILEFRKKTYFETTSEDYVRALHVRVTAPGSPPEDLGKNEVWLDVNLEQQTLVAFVGQTPIYATLVSSGKKSTVKEKDHRTPIGTFRIREKHVTTTMDGNGTVAGDLPYSIEDVPYAMYYDGSYAVHGAFWHNNFGVRMSHGCVNLAPLDAKHLFRLTRPVLREGWHGAWSTAEQPGSRVVIHD